jgi:predicted esterase
MDQNLNFVGPNGPEKVERTTVHTRRRRGKSSDRIAEVEPGAHGQRENCEGGFHQSQRVAESWIVGGGQVG